MLDVVYVCLKDSLDEGYEANVMKILKKKGLEGAAYFKNNNLMVSKRDFDAVKKALRFDKIPMTPPKIVVEVYEIGTPEYTKHTLEVTPGQSVNDVDEMLGIAQKKRTSMRETLAKMWGLDEGKNPFKKSEEKDLTKEAKGGKTMTGKKANEIDVTPEIKEK